MNELFNGSDSIVNVVVIDDKVYSKLVDSTPPTTIRLISIENPKLLI